MAMGGSGPLDCHELSTYTRNYYNDIIDIIICGLQAGSFEGLSCIITKFFVNH